MKLLSRQFSTLLFPVDYPVPCDRMYNLFLQANHEGNHSDKRANGIEAHSIRLQIIDDDIVHVSAIGKRFSTEA